MSTQNGAMGLLPLKGLTQKPTWVTDKDTDNSHWLFKSYHQCDLSWDRQSYKGCESRGGTEWTRMYWWRRGYRGLTSELQPISLERQKEYEWYLASPYGPVPALTLATETTPVAPANYDVVIGPDYHCPSEDYYSKLSKIAQAGHFANVSSASDGLYTRVIGSKHKFFFTNFSRHAVQVLFVYDPYPTTNVTGDLSPVGVMNACSRDTGGIGASRTASLDMSPIERIASSCESILIPPCMDKNDAGVTRTHEIKYSPKDHIPHHFDVGPVDGTTSLEGLWRLVDPSRLVPNSGIAKDLTGNQYSPWVNHAPDHSVGATYRMKTAVRIYTRLVLPHGRVHAKTDSVGLNVLEGYTGLNIHVKSEFINECVAIGMSKPYFNGNKVDYENVNRS